MEAGFAQHYHLSLDDMLSMSWRRFRVLFNGIFNWNDPEEEEAGQGQIASTVDWKGAQRDRESESPLITEFRGTQLDVGQGTDG